MKVGILLSIAYAKTCVNYQDSPKSQAGEEGRRMMEGSYELESVFHRFSPNHVPKPIAWGNYKSSPIVWFYVSAFHNMVNKVPEPEDFVSIIANVHRTSMGQSPNGKYGFQVPTHLANIPNDNTWQASWEAWFTQAIKQMFLFEEAVQGKNGRLEELKEGLYEKVPDSYDRWKQEAGQSSHASFIRICGQETPCQIPTLARL